MYKIVCRYKPINARKERCLKISRFEIARTIFKKKLFEDATCSSNSSGRLGFSGTPSELMPRELGQCEYEPGSEGEAKGPSLCSCSCSDSM